MKKKRYLFYVFLIIAFNFALAAVLAAGTAPKISNKTLILGKGQSFRLTIENNSKKVKWSSSKKKVAKVNKRGVVIAKKPGRTVITTKVGKKKYKCRVTVVPNPVNLDSYYNATSAGTSGSAGSTSSGSAAQSPAYTSVPSYSSGTGNSTNTNNSNTYKTYSYDLSFDTSTKTVNSVTNTRENYPVRVPLTFTTDDPNFNETSYTWSGMKVTDSNNGTSGGGKYVNAIFELKNKRLTLEGSGSYSDEDENTAMTFTVKYAGKYNVMSGYSDWKTITFKVNYISEYVRVENRWMENLAKKWQSEYHYNSLSPLQKLLIFTNHIARDHSYGAGGTFCDDLVTYHPNRYNEASGTCVTSSLAIMKFARHMLGYSKDKTQMVSAASGIPGNTEHVVARIKINGTWYYFEAGYGGKAPREWNCYTSNVDGANGQHTNILSGSPNPTGQNDSEKYEYWTGNGDAYGNPLPGFYLGYDLADVLSHVTA